MILHKLHELHGACMCRLNMHVFVYVWQCLQGRFWLLAVLLLWQFSYFSIMVNDILKIILIFLYRDMCVVFTISVRFKLI